MIKNIFEYMDELGPEKIIHIYEPDIDLKAVLAIDNTARGVGLGGLRMAEDVTVAEVVGLARAMTLKNAAADLPYGGAKAAILASPHISRTEKEKLIRGFGKAISHFTDYIPGPDMGLDEECMTWLYGEIGRGIGLPASMGGIPLDEIGATGFGLSIAVAIASGYCHLDLTQARLVVQGFGSVGQNVARFLERKGVILVAASDSRGVIYDPQGLDVEQLIAWKRAGSSLIEFPQGTKLDRDRIVDLECDIWIPAARPHVVNLSNVSNLKTKLVAQGANIPFTPEAEQICHDRNILVLPDFIANAGGVICGAIECQGGTKEQAIETIEQKIKLNTELVLREVEQTGISPRQAALKLARRRLSSVRNRHINCNGVAIAKS